ncbi:Uncharacterized protein APZ42_004946 [Daphnia magna]|uniref:Uncharacterized protein n=1 Tax=Daphnia magna TaxID=35525 RepID=A0A164GR74_9CRUS|nr:Uncharacterized protein APZ42_004946 [Daphnia magna]
MHELGVRRKPANRSSSNLPTWQRLRNLAKRVPNNRILKLNPINLPSFLIFVFESISLSLSFDQI